MNYTNNPLISIIIPVFNAEKYLYRCLDSIIHQTYKNLEIILIDDGSTDSSGNICDEYKKHDQRIIVVHQKNGGVGFSRNTGLDISKGEYVSFVDCDDYVDLTFIEVLFNNLKQNNTSLSVCSIAKIKANGKKTKYFTLKDEIVDVNTFLNRVCWNKLYSKKLFNDLRFPTEWGEDISIYLPIVQLAGRVITTSKYLYLYCEHENSITAKNSYKFYLGCFKARNQELDFIIHNQLRRSLINNNFIASYDSYLKIKREFKKNHQEDEFNEIKLLFNEQIKKAYPSLSLINKIRARYPILYSKVRIIFKIIFFPIVILRKIKHLLFK